MKTVLDIFLFVGAIIVVYNFIKDTICLWKEIHK